MKTVQSPCTQLSSRFWSGLPSSACLLQPSDFALHSCQALVQKIVDQAEQAAAVHRAIDPETVFELLYG